MIKGYEPEDAIKAVLNWAEQDGNEDFDPNFVESLSEKYERYGELSPGQFNALSNIVTKFQIDISQYI